MRSSYRMCLDWLSGEQLCCEALVDVGTGKECSMLDRDHDQCRSILGPPLAEPGSRAEHRVCKWIGIQ